MTTDPIEILAAHVVDTGYADLPADAVGAAKTYILDSLGVGVAGSAGPWVTELLDAVAGWGAGDDSRVFVHGTRLPAASAAVVNAYLIHCLEYDCVNEHAVIHPMATILGAVSAEADRRGDVNGRDLLTAVAVGVDSSCVIGLSSNAAMRFFRPSTAGAFGATAAIAKLRGFDAATTVNAFGATYGQISGTLQPHKEGSPVLGMQIGFCARGAITACDLAERGLIGPHDVLDGQYGYFPLYEGAYDWRPVFAKLGSEWQINNVSHKPFPSGRLTHGAVDGIQQIKGREAFAPDDVAKIVAIVPPLAYRLTGRPDIANPSPNYAKLCIPFVAATTVLEGTVDVQHFERAWLDNPAVHDLAARVECVQDDNPDENVVAPQRLEMTLTDGRHFEVDMPEVFGHPDNPLSREQNIDKFRRNWQVGARPLPADAGERMVELIDDLESVANVADLIGLTVST